MTPSPTPSENNKLIIRETSHTVRVEPATEVHVIDGVSHNVIVEGPTNVHISQRPAVRVVASHTGLQGATGPIGLTGPPGAGASEQFVYEQTVPARVWTVLHNMGRRPPVSVIDSGNEEVEGEVRYPDLNTAILTFSGAFSGIATLGG